MKRTSSLAGLALAILLVAGAARSQEQPPTDPAVAEMQRAHKLREQGKLAEAREAYARVVAMKDAHPRDRAGSQLWIGILLAEEGDRARAKAELEKVLGLEGVDPGDKKLAEERLKKLRGE